VDINGDLLICFILSPAPSVVKGTWAEQPGKSKYPHHNGKVTVIGCAAAQVVKESKVIKICMYGKDVKPQLATFAHKCRSLCAVLQILKIAKLKKK